MNVIGDVRGKNAILVDDIVDTGGSLVAAAQIVKDNGAKTVHFAATHGVLSGPAMERIRDILVDDIVDTGGSLVAAAQIVKDNGAKTVHFAATHGVLSGPAMERIRDSALTEVIVTNTVPLSDEKKAITDKVKVVSVGYMIAKTIEAIQSHTPVSDVYNYFSREE